MATKCIKFKVAIIQKYKKKIQHLQYASKFYKISKVQNKVYHLPINAPTHSSSTKESTTYCLAS